MTSTVRKANLTRYWIKTSHTTKVPKQTSDHNENNYNNNKDNNYKEDDNKDDYKDSQRKPDSLLDKNK